MARYPLDLPVRYVPGQLEKTTSYFTTFYLGNYVDNDFRENVGSHPGVDILPAKPSGWVTGTVAAAPVYAVLAGTVVKATNSSFDGNYVVVRHDGVPDPANPSGTCSLCSCYLHLTDYSVSVGQSVAEGDVIGRTGNTGNVVAAPGGTGEHLHFQMDRVQAQYHAYWPYTLTEAKAAGLTFFTAANAGLGIERARQWTVNPLVYLDALARGTSVSAAVFGASATVAVASSSTASALASAASVFSSEATLPVSQPAKPSADATRLGAASSELFGPAAQPSKPASGSASQPAKPATVAFSDVKNDPAVAWIAQQGIASGFDDGTFRPRNPLTRAEFLKLVFKFGNIVPDASASLTFSDVDPSHWSAPYVATAHAKGWIQGYPDGKFRPNSPVSRLEALGMTLNVLVGKDDVARAGFGTTMKDVASASWGAPYVGFAEEHGLMTTFDGPKFLPNNPMLRVRMAELLYKLHTQLGMRAA